jgi:glycerate-2-kinase
MKFIKNYNKLIKGASALRKDVLKILEYTLKDINPEKAIKRAVIQKNNILKITDLKIDLDKIKNIYVVGGGKASFLMAKALYDIIDNRIKNGIISVNNATKNKIGPIKIIEAGHPLPTKEGIEASKNMVKIAEEARENDIIIALISGGGSALLPLPYGEITINDLRETNKLLLASGASIDEINIVRKHISMIKGGRLSISAYPAKIISLIISDVVGDDISSIASGPTAGDDSTFLDAYRILKYYNISKNVPSSVLKTLKNGIKGKISETPNSNNSVFKKTFNRIILNNLSALKTCRKKAKEFNYNTLILSSVIEGDAKNVGIFHSAIAKEVKLSANPVKLPAIIISGGETTVTLEKYGKSKGGRNQECVIGFLSKFTPTKKEVFLSVGSDGIDGNSEFAGGIIGGSPLSFKKEELIKSLETHSTSEFLKRINGNILTGVTGTNVNDIRILGIGH